MKTARENISIFTSHDALKRLMAEYENFDTARRLCADYCITAGDVARLIDKNPKPKRLKSRPYIVRSDKAMDESYLLAR